MAQVAQGGCGVSLLGDTQNLSGHGPGQPAPCGPTWAEGWTGWLPEVPANLKCSIILQSWSGSCCLENSWLFDFWLSFLPFPLLLLPSTLVKYNFSVKKMILFPHEKLLCDYWYDFSIDQRQFLSYKNFEKNWWEPRSLSSKRGQILFPKSIVMYHSSFSSSFYHNWMAYRFLSQDICLKDTYVHLKEFKLASYVTADVFYKR